MHKLQLFDHVHVDLGGLPSRYPFLLVTPQYNTERVLEQHARQCGATIVEGAEVTGLAQDDGGVTVRTATGEYRARYVVGADGVHSAVRDAIGLPFPGVSVVKSIMLADVRLADPPGDVLAVNAVADGFAFIAPFGDGWYRVFAWNPRNPLPDTAPVDFEEIRSVVRHAFRTDFGMHDPRWMSRFHSDERQAPHYRVGNVFLAGDAAHCHSPAGGQGMNTGIQDAANLGWKLAGTVRGWAPDGLLDTYEAERFPVGKSVLRSSGALIRLGMVRSSIARSLRATVGSAAMHVPAITDRAANLISGIGIAYDYPNGGERAPDIELADGRLYHALRTGRFVLLSAHKKVAGGWSDRVDMAVAPSQQGTVTLVRPDAYIGWSGGAGDAEGLRDALHTWCGTATANP